MNQNQLIVRISEQANDFPSNQENQSQSFFVAALITFMIVTLSAHIMSFFPKGMEVATLFINELYCIRIDEDMDEIFDQEEDQDQPITPVQRYEEKYVDAIAKMVKKELTPEYVEGLLNNFVMENTPSGNVMMRYNSVKGSFEYYSDNIIPNRFLDVVARKFVRTYDCTALYDVEKSEALTIIVPSETTESKPASKVFAKFKTYNSGPSGNKTSSSSTTTVSKKNIPAKEVITSNRYTSCGKMANMQMLKKVDRKAVDKTYRMSFSEFKQLKCL
jgi:hypothetical protein